MPSPAVEPAIPSGPFGAAESHRFRPKDSTLAPARSDDAHKPQRLMQAEARA